MKIIDNLKQIISNIKNFLFGESVPMIEASKEKTEKSFAEKLQDDYSLDTPEENDDLSNVKQYAYIFNYNFYPLPKYVILTEEFDNYPSHIIGETRYFNSDNLSDDQKFHLIDTIITQMDTAIHEFIDNTNTPNSFKEKHLKIADNINGYISLYKFQKKHNKPTDIWLHSMEHSLIDLINLTREIENHPIISKEPSLEI